MPERLSRGPLQIFDPTPDSINDQLSKVRDELDELHDSTEEVAATVTVIIPTGVILPYGGSAAPTGYLMCDGTAISRSTYPALFAVLATTFGVGDGSATFNLPDLRGRAMFGQAAAGTFATLGSTGGAESATLPAHTHTLAAGATVTDAGGALSATTGNPNSSPTIAVLNPYAVVNFIIKT